MERPTFPRHRLRDAYWRCEPWVTQGVVVTGAASPLWGPLLARALRWPSGLTIGLVVGPIGGFLLAGRVHDLLRRRAALPAAVITWLELLAAILFNTAVFILPLVRHYRRRPSPRKASGAGHRSRPALILRCT